jgi:hypothetical protein
VTSSETVVCALTVTGRGWHTPGRLLNFPPTRYCPGGRTAKYFPSDEVATDVTCLPSPSSTTTLPRTGARTTASAKRVPSSRPDGEACVHAARAIDKATPATNPRRMHPFLHRRGTEQECRLSITTAGGNRPVRLAEPTVCAGLLVAPIPATTSLLGVLHCAARIEGTYVTVRGAQGTFTDQAPTAVKIASTMGWPLSRILFDPW